MIVTIAFFYNSIQLTAIKFFVLYSIAYISTWRHGHSVWYEIAETIKTLAETRRCDYISYVVVASGQRPTSSDS